MRLTKRIRHDIWRDIRADIRSALALDHLEQASWTHNYMQFWRTACRAGPVVIAHLCGVGFPLLVALALCGWLR